MFKFDKNGKYYRWNKTNIDYLRYLVENQMISPVVIAEDLGITRQRIYQLMKKHKISPNIHSEFKVKLLKRKMWEDKYEDG